MQMPLNENQDVENNENQDQLQSEPEIIHNWKFKNFKFPSPLPDGNETNVMIMNITKKKNEPKKVTPEEVFRIFGYQSK
jgi:hypothetical protein